MKKSRIRQASQGTTGHTSINISLSLSFIVLSLISLANCDELAIHHNDPNVTEIISGDSSAGFSINFDSPIVTDGNNNNITSLNNENMISSAITEAMMMNIQETANDLLPVMSDTNDVVHPNISTLLDNGTIAHEPPSLINSNNITLPSLSPNFTDIENPILVKHEQESLNQPFSSSSIENAMVSNTSTINDQLQQLQSIETNNGSLLSSSQLGVNATQSSLFLEQRNDVDKNDQIVVDGIENTSIESWEGVQQPREPQRSNFDSFDSDVISTIVNDQSTLKEEEEVDGVGVVILKASVVCLGAGLLIFGARRILMAASEPNDYKTAWRNAYNTNNAMNHNNSVLPTVLGRSTTRDVEYQPLR